MSQTNSDGAAAWPSQTTAAATVGTLGTAVYVPLADWKVE